MKITSGKYKYRKIELPKGIRPTTEKVREAIFSMATGLLPGSSVLDLFAGSGAMGLEALSRGAKRCVFCEKARHVQPTLLANIENCKAGPEASLIGKDYVSALTELADRGERFDIVIMDPPYEKTGYYPDAMQKLQELELLNEGAIVIAEHIYNNKLSEEYSDLVRVREKKYGSIGVDIYKLRENSED